MQSLCGSSGINCILMQNETGEKMRTRGKHMEFYLDRSEALQVCVYQMSSNPLGCYNNGILLINFSKCHK